MKPSHSIARSAPESTMTHSRTPLFSSNLLEEYLERECVDQSRSDLIRQFRRDGYLVLPHFVAEDLVDRVAASYPWLFDPETQFDVDEHALHKLRRDPNRIHDAWQVCDPVKQLASDAGVSALLGDLFGRGAIPFQTLNFATGSMQDMHSDAMSFASHPRGFMCGVWVALEDARIENGALVMAKGSHTFPEIDVSDLGRWAEVETDDSDGDFPAYDEYVQAQLRVHDPELVPVECTKGTAIIWASNTLHAGSPISDRSATRMSQATHYFFDDCFYFTPRFSDTALGVYKLRDVHDIRTNALVPHTLLGEELVEESVLYPNQELKRLLRPRVGDPGGMLSQLTQLKSDREALMDHVKEVKDHRGELIEQLAGYSLHQEELMDRLADFESHQPQLLGQIAELRDHVLVLESERDLQRTHADALLSELESQRAHSTNLELKVLHLESVLSKVSGHGLYRLRTLLARLFGK